MTTTDSTECDLDFEKLREDVSKKFTALFCRFSSKKTQIQKHIKVLRFWERHYKLEHLNVPFGIINFILKYSDGHFDNDRMISEHLVKPIPMFCFLFFCTIFFVLFVYTQTCAKKY